VGPGVPPITLAPSCGNGGTAGSTGGSFQLGNAAFRFAVTGLPAAALPLLSLSLPGAPPPVCGPCVIPPPVVLQLEANLGGTASSAFALPCDGGLLGFTVDSQWLSLVAGAAPCPLVPDVVASSLVRFTLGD
jgi:hypothetical protein